jgi:hypothetical protein
MPQVEVPADGRVEIIANPAAFSSYAVNHISGPRVFLAHTPRQTREQGQVVDEGDRTVLRDLNQEPVYAKTPAGASEPAIIDVRKTGFLIQYVQRTDIDVSTQSSQSVVEVNADQTSTVSSLGGNETSTVFADAGELWTLQKFEFGYTSENEEFKVNIFTTAEGVEVGFAEQSNATSTGHEYRSGQWTGPWTTTRDDIVGTQIDDTNGLSVEFVNAGAGDINNPRDIRFQFEVTQVA